MAQSPLSPGGVTCGICLDEIKEAGELDSCYHKFCWSCISRWAEIETTCPFCKARFSQLRRKQLAPGAEAIAKSNPNSELPGIYIDTLQTLPERNQRVVYEDPSFEQWIDSVLCLVW